MNPPYGNGRGASSPLGNGLYKHVFRRQKFSYRHFFMPLIVQDFHETPKSPNPPQTQHASEPKRPFAPPIDIYDLGHMYIVLVCLPGVHFDNVETAVVGDTNSLDISGTFSNPFSRLYDCLLVSERHLGTFQRSVKFPPSVKIDRNQIKMNMANGILEIHVLKETHRLK